MINRYEVVVEQTLIVYAGSEEAARRRAESLSATAKVVKIQEQALEAATGLVEAPNAAR